MNFEKLAIWQQSKQLSVLVYSSFMKCRDYGFKDQITRASLSIPSNIAEGMTRHSDLEKVRFLNIALGSCAELKTQIIIGFEITYIHKTNKRIWIKKLDEISRMIHGLIKKIREGNSG